MSNLTDKVIIVTGGSGLLGKELLKSIIAQGGTAVNFDIKPSSITGESFIKTDINSCKNLKSSINKVKSEFKTIHGLVNNAYPRTSDWGIPFEEDLDLESWRKNIDLQLNSYVYCCQQIVPTFKENGGGSIVNIASIYGSLGNDLSLYEGTSIKTAAPYSAIKGGLINFSRYLASYLGKSNIRVNCVSPGGIFDNHDKIFVNNYEKKVPLGRMANPEDIAPAVSFLLSDGAKYITGQNLNVDGGWTCI